MSEDLPQAKYVVEVTVPEKSPPTPKQYIQDLKGVVGGKQLAKMKKEAVECPVLAKTVSFAQCFACPNFIRRGEGKVDVRGFPLPASAGGAAVGRGKEVARWKEQAGALV